MNKVDQEELVEVIDEAITDSLDIDWTTKIGAQAVMDAFKKEGWVVHIARASVTAKPRNFREAVDQFEQAVRDDAFKGALPPSEHDTITSRYTKTKNSLIEYFTACYNRAYRQGESVGQSRAANSPGNGDMGG